MKKPEMMFSPEIPDYEKLITKIEILKEKFPDIGIVCNGMKPMDKKVELYNRAKPSFMQFRPKNPEERKILDGINETAPNTSIHLEDPKFDIETGTMDAKRKEETIEILKHQGNANSFKLITMHSGLRDANLILDEQGNWRNTESAEKAANELADIFTAGIEAGKIMTIENVGSEEPIESLGTKPEHLITTRQKIAQIISTKTGVPAEEILSKIGYTFDLGHAVKNTRLLKQCSVEKWLELIGKDIKLMHIHDVLPPEALPDPTLPPEHKNSRRREHKAFGRGIIDWKSFFQLKNKYCPDVKMILEINDDGDGANTVRSIEYLENSAQ